MKIQEEKKEQLLSLAEREKLYEQLELFGLEKEYGDWTRALNHDTLPWFFKGKLETREQSIRKIKFTGGEIRISPATLERNIGDEEVFVGRYAGMREVHVLRVIRKISSEEGRLLVRDGSYYVQFSLREIERRLQEIKQRHNRTEIKEALTVLIQSNYEATFTVMDKEGKDRVVESSLLRRFAGFKCLREDNGDDRYELEFSASEARMIVNNEYRALSYSATNIASQIKDKKKGSASASTIGQLAFVLLSEFKSAGKSYNVNDDPYKIYPVDVLACKCGMDISSPAYIRKAKMFINDALAQLKTAGFVREHKIAKKEFKDFQIIRGRRNVVMVQKDAFYVKLSDQYAQMVIEANSESNARSSEITHKLAHCNLSK